MKDKLAQYKQYKEELSAELRKYVQDKNNPLDERFEALCECPELSGQSDRTDFGLEETRDEEEMFDFSYRYRVYLVTEILDRLVGYFEDRGFTKEEEITFKEYCCDNFISSMIFDW